MVLFRIIGIILALAFLLCMGTFMLTGQPVWRQRAILSLKWGVAMALCFFGYLILRRAGLMVSKTSSVSGWVGVMCSAWAVINWLASPPESHAAFAMIIAMGSLATAYCLSSIRFAAILNLVIGVVPISALMLTSGRPAEVAAATSLVLATLILVRFILQGHALLGHGQGFTLSHAPAGREPGAARRRVQPLTHQQLTDLGRAPSFYDCLVQV